jgi:hypothetical protein
MTAIDIASIVVFSTLLMAMLLCVFALFRNKFVYEIMQKSTFAISRYCDNLISEGKYNMSINYFNEMLISYEKYFLSIWLWKPIDCIKKEYRDLIEPFFDK